jgi:Zn-finger nucleic acid-binding protein
MPEPALRCPGCGAPAAADTVSCAYCGSALATVTCPSCFAPMFKGSRFCGACGAEAIREVLDDETPLSCPRCKESMEHMRLGGTTLRTCLACGGLWLDPESLQRLCDTREERSSVVSVLAARVPTSSVSPDVVRYIPCPTCTKLMNRTNFAQASGVILDVCKQHGVWLDRGELQRVMGFVDAGGMAVSREREKEKLAEEQRRLLALQSAPAAGTNMGSFVVTTRTSTWSGTNDNMGRSIEHVLNDLLNLGFAK